MARKLLTHFGERCSVILAPIAPGSDSFLRLFDEIIGFVVEAAFCAQVFAGAAFVVAASGGEDAGAKGAGEAGTAGAPAADSTSVRPSST